GRRYGARGRRAQGVQLRTLTPDERGALLLALVRPEVRLAVAKHPLRVRDERLLARRLLRGGAGRRGALGSRRTCLLAGRRDPQRRCDDESNRKPTPHPTILSPCGK